MRRSAVVLLLVVSRAYADPAPELTKEFQAGVDAFRLGHFAEARTHLEKARDMDPKLPGPHRFLAAVAQSEGHWQDASTNRASRSPRTRRRSRRSARRSCTRIAARRRDARRTTGPSSSTRPRSR